MSSKLVLTIRLVMFFSLFCFLQNVLAVKHSVNHKKSVKVAKIYKAKKNDAVKSKKKTKVKTKKIVNTRKSSVVMQPITQPQTTVQSQTGTQSESVVQPQAVVTPQPVAQPQPVVQSQNISQPIPSANVAKSSSFIPAPPNFDVKAYILMDANTGYIMAEKNADQRLEPASLTKVMSLYIVADALRSGKIHLTDQVTISENAWRVGGSRMFIKVGSAVSIKDLISGIVTVSGNDATVAMAEHLMGSEDNFANLMSQTAKNLGMNNSNFTDSNGLPSSNHYSTARDLATLSRSWILNFPEYYPWFKEKWFTHNNIKQPNRNRLLWRDPSVDGIKTGHTDEAGYCLIASAMRHGMRLISVVLGAKNDELRTKNSETLLNYGFRFFETQKLFSANTQVVAPRVWLGKEKTAILGLKDDFYVTLQAGPHSALQAKAEVSNKLRAPIIKGKPYGVLNVTLDGKVITSQPLVALQDNPRTNILFALYDYIIMLFRHHQLSDTSN